MFRDCSVTRSRHIADKRLPSPPQAIPKIKTSRTSNEDCAFKRAEIPAIPANTKLRPSILAATRKMFFPVIRNRSCNAADEGVQKYSPFSARMIKRLLTADTK